MIALIVVVLMLNGCIHVKNMVALNIAVVVSALFVQKIRWMLKMTTDLMIFTAAMTKPEKDYQDRLANVVGCCVCRFYLDIFNNYVSIHHCDGRTKPGCQKKVLPLCFFHHQGGTKDNPSIHPWKARFEKLYGSQESLRKRCNNILGDVDI